jgi:hypothetical protein
MRSRRTRGDWPLPCSAELVDQIEDPWRICGTCYANVLSAALELHEQWHEDHEPWWPWLRMVIRRRLG